MSTITPFLWFDTQAEEAANFYVGLFPNSRMLSTTPAPDGTPDSSAGGVLTVEFELDGVRFTGLNGGPHFRFTEAVSFVIDCADQAEVDRYWEALLADGGEESQCGWLKDRFGLSWQVVPKQLNELLGDPDPGRSSRAMKAMLQMRKLDVAALQAAADAP
ncbi:VOC family protein [uncultured Friedmanniella sp.]|uniref:VOC family protein n=1 Tax=uncultured Friedmanniella sp. TaxID=335381 RepID=UPI0035CBDBD4